jgi:hypothetical protein
MNRFFSLLDHAPVPHISLLRCGFSGGAANLLLQQPAQIPRKLIDIEVSCIPGIISRLQSSVVRLPVLANAFRHNLVAADESALAGRPPTTSKYLKSGCPIHARLLRMGGQAQNPAGHLVSNKSPGVRSPYAQRTQAIPHAGGPLATDDWVAHSRGFFAREWGTSTARTATLRITSRPSHPPPHNHPRPAPL